MKKAGFVALIGEPNAGKSTLLNHFVGSKVSIVTHKVQTTRTKIRGIVIVDNAQIVFVDTPGLFKPRRRLDRAMVAAAWGGAADADVIVLLIEAQAIHDEDRAMCHAIGRFGSELLQDGTGVITHCNAGGLATSEYGTALSLFFTAQDEGKNLTVYVDETRPLLQGARLTAWELQRRDVETILICDNMAAQVMREGKVQAVVTGADRIAANGDAANKIGTYVLAILAKHHSIPFYVAAPSNTFDLKLESGSEIPIEVREADEITHGFGRQTGPDEINVYNPAFDVTPAELIAGIVTEKGIISPVNRENVLSVLQR